MGSGFTSQVQAYAESSRNLLETAWGELIDPRERLWDDPKFSGTYGYNVFSTGRPEDRFGGKLRPIYETESDLDDIRAAARLLTDTSAAAIGALLNLTNFVIGPGFVYTAQPEPRMDTPRELVVAVQRVLDEFLDDNDWCGDLERELFRRSRRDGEFFLATYNVQGQCQVRIVDPERIREPRRSDWADGRKCSFGIEVNDEDIEHVLGYYVQWDDDGYQLDYLPRERVEHCRLNVDRNIKRGISDFFAIDPDLQSAKTLLRNTVKGASVQAAIAYIVQHATGTTASQIQAIQQTNATLRWNETDSVSSKTRYQQTLKPGTRLDVSKGMEYKGSPLASGEAANAYVAILQASLRSIGVRWAMPEYMISGDASNANYSSTMVAESPFVRNCEVEQAFYRRRFARVIWKAIRFACDAGRFRKIIGDDFELLQSLIDVNIEPPNVAVRDATQETTRRKLMVDGGILSQKTWAAQEGLDYEQEQVNGATKAGPPPQFASQPSTGPSQLAAGTAGTGLAESARAAWSAYP